MASLIYNLTLALLFPVHFLCYPNIYLLISNFYLKINLKENVKFRFGFIKSHKRNDGLYVLFCFSCGNLLIKLIKYDKKKIKINGDTYVKFAEIKLTLSTNFITVDGATAAAAAVVMMMMIIVVVAGESAVPMEILMR